jgi:DNA-binding MarR family transcriptional regulator
MPKDEAFFKETEALRNLRAMEEIEKNPQISQRELAGQLGAALGITNALLKALVRKGLIKIRGANNRSLTYHLTHAGVLAKSQLAMKWTLNTIDFYRQARTEVVDKLTALSGQGVKTAVLYGVGELTEIAFIVAAEAGLEITGIVDVSSGNGHGSMLGCPTIDLKELGDLRLDSVIVCVDTDDEEMARLGRHIEAGTRLYRLI